MKNTLEQALKKAPKLKDIAPDFKIPEFSSDEEEIAWLDKNHERLGRLAEKHGLLVRFGHKEPTQQISIRLPVRDIEQAKKIATRNKENYQTVLKRAVRAGLIKATA
jgi:predicted DNA binding CopG/RHH family protein